jgi:hypothetical protein
VFRQSVTRSWKRPAVIAIAWAAYSTYDTIPTSLIITYRVTNNLVLQFAIDDDEMIFAHRATIFADQPRIGEHFVHLLLRRM